MLDEVEALVRREERERDRHELTDLVEGAWARRPQERFQLRKRHLDRIEVRAVGRQEPEARADTGDRGLHLRLFVHHQVVEDHNVARAERRCEHLLDVPEECGIVDRAVEDRGSRQAVDAQRGDDGVRLPVPARRVIPEADASWAASIAAQEIRRDARFIDEDVGARVVHRLRVLPVVARGGDVRTSLFVGVHRCF